VTFQQDQIQALIVEIDSVLQKTSPRLPWVMSGDATQQRQTLERIRNFLVDLQQGSYAATSDLPPNLMAAYDIYSQGAQPSGAISPATDAALSAQQVLQVLTQEIGLLRANLMQPLQAEMDTLRQQREALLQEVRQLELQRNAYALPGAVNSQQIAAEVVQVLMSHLQTALPQQIAQSIQALPSREGYIPAYQATEQIRAVQNQSDELLVNLDTTIRIVFESLQRDIQTYQESLAQGVEQMHTLGQQGEMMFSALVSHLAQQIGREASSYLQSGVPRPEEIASVVPPSLTSAPTPPQSAKPTAPSAPIGFPYAGIELSQTEPAVPSSVDIAIDSWLNSLSEEEASSASSTAFPQVNLDDVDLATVDATTLDFLLDESAIAPPATPQSIPDDTTDIDAALQLLESSLGSATTQASELAAEAEAVINQVLGMEVPTESAEPPVSPIAAEVDDLYESMFGDQTSQPEPEAIEAAPEPVGLLTTPDNTEEFAPEPGDISEVLPGFDPTDGWDVLAEAPADFSMADSDLSFELTAPAATSEVSELDQVADLPLPLTEPETATSIDEISSLTELFAPEPTSVDSGLSPTLPLQPAVSSPLEAPATSVIGEDIYIPASPDEVLLPPKAEATETPSVGFWLDATTLSDLSEDLSNLEEGFLDAGVLPPELGIELPTEPSLDSWFEPEPPNPDIAAAPESYLPSQETTPVGEATTFDRPESFEQISSEPIPVYEPPMLIEDGFESGESFVTPPQSEADAPVPFTLEGMDDLFVDEPTVEAAPPPAIVPELTPPVFTLEGMDDLFADIPPVSATPAPPPGMSSPATLGETDSQPFTLEGMDDLFGNLPSSDAPSVSSESQATAESDDFFGDFPGLEPPAVSMPEAMTPSGTADFFGDLGLPEAPVTPAPETAQSPQAEDLFGGFPDFEVPSTPALADMTLEDSGVFFGDLSPAAAAAEPAIEVTQPTAGDDLFGDFPALDVPDSVPEDMTLADSTNFFGDLPPVEPPATPTPTTPPPDSEDLFGDFPASDVPSGAPEDMTLADSANFFGDLPPAEPPATPPPITLPPDSEDLFGDFPASDVPRGAPEDLTLADSANFFGDLPPVETPTLNSSEELSLAGEIDFFPEEPLSLTLEEASTPVSPEQSSSDTPAVFTIEQVNGVFTEVELPSAPIATVRSGQPNFVIENRAGVFVEVASGMDSQPNLEGEGFATLDSLFDDPDPNAEKKTQGF